MPRSLLADDEDERMRRVQGLLDQPLGDTARQLANVMSYFPTGAGDVAEVGLVADKLRDPGFRAKLGENPLKYNPGQSKFGMPPEYSSPYSLLPNEAQMQTAFAAIPLMTAFHGSPHKFDQFKLEKIGTGEGAQAYGHGLYFAESPGVAKTYQSAGPALDAQTVVAGFGGEREAVEALSKQIADGLPAPQVARRQKLIELIESGDYKRGHLYEVDIPDEAIDKMLDWDKPLSEQPESVRKALESSGLVLDQARLARIQELEAMKDALAKDRLPNNRMRNEARWHELSREHEALLKDKLDIPYYGMKPDGSWGLLERNAPAGNALYEALVQKTGSAEGASNALNQLGIPGIKYLDGSSRTAGEGTRNFVVFDESIPKIIKRD